MAPIIQTSGLVWGKNLCEKVRSASGTKRGKRRAMGTLPMPVTFVRLGKSLGERAASGQLIR